MIHLQVKHDTRLILAYGYFPSGVPDDTIDIVEIESDTILNDLIGDGDKYLNEDLTIRTEPLITPDVTPSQSEMIVNIIDQGLVAVEGATTEELPAVFAGVLNGLKTIFGGS